MIGVWPLTAVLWPFFAGIALWPDVGTNAAQGPEGHLNRVVSEGRRLAATGLMGAFLRGDARALQITPLNTNTGIGPVALDDGLTAVVAFGHRVLLTGPEGWTAFDFPLHSPKIRFLAWDEERLWIIDASGDGAAFTRTGEMADHRPSPPGANGIRDLRRIDGHWWLLDRSGSLWVHREDRWHRHRPACGGGPSVTVLGGPADAREPVLLGKDGELCAADGRWRRDGLDDSVELLRVRRNRDLVYAIEQRRGPRRRRIRSYLRRLEAHDTGLRWGSAQELPFEPNDVAVIEEASGPTLAIAGSSGGWDLRVFQAERATWRRIPVSLGAVIAPAKVFVCGPILAAPQVESLCVQDSFDHEESPQ